MMVPLLHLPLLTQRISNWILWGRSPHPLKMFKRLREFISCLGSYILWAHPHPPHHFWLPCITLGLQFQVKVPAKEPCIFVSGRAGEKGSHGQMSKRIKFPSLPARAELRNPGQPGSCPGFWLRWIWKDGVGASQEVLHPGKHWAPEPLCTGLSRSFSSY